jgi:hypothetical protein
VRFAIAVGLLAVIGAIHAAGVAAALVLVAVVGGAALLVLAAVIAGLRWWIRTADTYGRPRL